MNTKPYDEKFECTYGAIEAYLNVKGYKIKHLFRDSNGDWGDDGGFIIAISEKESAYHLTCIRVDYNNELYMLYGGAEFIDIKFNTLAECYNKLIAILEIVKSCDIDDIYFYIDTDEFMELINCDVSMEDEQTLNFVKILCTTFSMYDYDADIEKLKNISKSKYVENFIMYDNGSDDDFTINILKSNQ